MSAERQHHKASRIAKIVVILTVVLACVAIVGANSKSKDNDNSETQTEQKQATSLSKDVVENICTDAKYGVNHEDGYTPIDVWDYNFQTYDYAYDINGNVIVEAQWNGKRDNDRVFYHCYVSGTGEDDAQVYWVSAGDKDLWKSEDDLNYASYDQDGKPIYTELHQ